MNGPTGPTKRTPDRIPPNWKLEVQPFPVFEVHVQRRKSTEVLPGEFLGEPEATLAQLEESSKVVRTVETALFLMTNIGLQSYISDAGEPNPMAYYDNHDHPIRDEGAQCLQGLKSGLSFCLSNLGGNTNLDIVCPHCWGKLLSQGIAFQYCRSCGRRLAKLPPGQKSLLLGVRDPGEIELLARTWCSIAIFNPVSALLVAKDLTEVLIRSFELTKERRVGEARAARATEQQAWDLARRGNEMLVMKKYQAKLLKQLRESLQLDETDVAKVSDILATIVTD